MSSWGAATTREEVVGLEGRGVVVQFICRTAN